MIDPVKYHIGYVFKGEKNDKKIEVKGVYSASVVFESFTRNS